MLKFSVLTSVYKNDKPDQLELALKSVYDDQTLKPNEIVLMVDGPISDELKEVIKERENNCTVLKVYWQDQNQGLGMTLNNGMQKCTFDIIARMDADDISLPTRFEKELKALVEKDLDIIGSNIAEFTDDPSSPNSYRLLPSEDKDIKKYMKSRCGFCHVTVMFKKSKVLEAGGYLHLYHCEDYYLWARMMNIGAKMGNLNEVLVNVRMDKDGFKRRSGYEYYKSHKTLFKYMLKQKLINYFEYIKNIHIRFGGEVILSNNMREKIYKRHLRGKNGTDTNEKAN